MAEGVGANHEASAARITSPSTTPEGLAALPRFILGWSLAVTFLRALRHPNDWAEAHWLVHYGLGIVKRGLPGTVLDVFCRPILSVDGYETTIVVVSSAITAGFSICVLRMVFAIVSWRRCTSAGLLLGVTLVTSPFVVISGHLTGYFDHQIFMLTWLAILLTCRRRHWLAAVVMSIGVLIHESIFVLGLPSVLWTFWMSERMRPLAARAGWFGSVWLTRSLVPYCLPVATFATIVVLQASLSDPLSARRGMTDYLSSFAFIERDRAVLVPRALTTGFGEYLRTLGPSAGQRLLARPYAVTVLPCVGLALLVIRSAVRHSRPARTIVATAVGICMAPLGLFLVAWDISRIWTYPLVTALTLLWATARLVEPDRARRWWLPNSLGLVAIGTNLMYTIPLMDRYVDNLSLGPRLLAYSPALIAGAWVAIRDDPRPNETDC